MLEKCTAPENQSICRCPHFKFSKGPYTTKLLPYYSLAMFISIFYIICFYQNEERNHLLLRHYAQIPLFEKSHILITLLNYDKIEKGPARNALRRVVPLGIINSV